MVICGQCIIWASYRCPRCWSGAGPSVELRLPLHQSSQLMFCPAQAHKGRPPPHASRYPLENKGATGRRERNEWNRNHFSNSVIRNRKSKSHTSQHLTLTKQDITPPSPRYLVLRQVFYTGLMKVPLTLWILGIFWLFPASVTFLLPELKAKSELV